MPFESRSQKQVVCNGSAETKLLADTTSPMQKMAKATEAAKVTKKRKNKKNKKKQKKKKHQ